MGDAFLVQNIKQELRKKYALSFDGVDDYVNLGNPTLSIANAYSITVRFKVDNISSAMQLLANDNGSTIASGRRIWQFRLNDTGQIEFIRFASSNTLIEVFATTNTFDDNQFHWATVVFDSSVGSKIYVDGVEEASSNNTTANNSGTTNDYYIGALQNRSGGSTTSFVTHLDGEINNAQIWQKALSSTEINNFINTLPVGNETDLFAYYNFDEGTGTTLGDSAGNNDGTIVGATWIEV
jgi:hypothetical protein